MSWASEGVESKGMLTFVSAEARRATKATRAKLNNTSTVCKNLISATSLLAVYAPD